MIDSRVSNIALFTRGFCLENSEAKMIADSLKSSKLSSFSLKCNPICINFRWQDFGKRRAVFRRGDQTMSFIKKYFTPKFGRFTEPNLTSRWNSPCSVVRIWSRYINNWSISVWEGTKNGLGSDRTNWKDKNSPKHWNPQSNWYQRTRSYQFCQATKSQKKKERSLEKH